MQYENRWEMLGKEIIVGEIPMTGAKEGHDCRVSQVYPTWMCYRFSQGPVDTSLLVLVGTRPSGMKNQARDDNGTDRHHVGATSPLVPWRQAVGPWECHSLAAKYY